MLKGRYVLLWFIAAGGSGVVVSLVARPDMFVGSDLPSDPWSAALMIAAIEGAWFGLTVLHARAVGLKVGDLFRADGVRPWRHALVAMPMVGSTLVCIYLVFAPLSLVFPDATQAWLFEDPLVLYLPGPPYPLAANVASFLAVCLIAPIAEEWIFRGLLLRRWSQKLGGVRGVVRSSLLFCLMHTDLLGSFIFGVTMAGLYARYRTLWAPTIAHVANNTLAFGMAVFAAHRGDALETATVEQLRADWWMPVVGAAVALPWAIRLRRSWTPVSRWEFGPVGPPPAATPLSCTDTPSVNGKPSATPPRPADRIRRRNAAR